MSAPRFFYLSPFYQCATLLPFLAIFMSAPRFFYLSPFYQCATFLPFLVIFRHVVLSAIKPGLIKEDKQRQSRKKEEATLFKI